VWKTAKPESVLQGLDYVEGKETNPTNSEGINVRRKTGKRSGNNVRKYAGRGKAIQKRLIGQNSGVKSVDWKYGEAGQHQRGIRLGQFISQGHDGNRRMS